MNRQVLIYIISGICVTESPEYCLVTDSFSWKEHNTFCIASATSKVIGKSFTDANVAKRYFEDIVRDRVDFSEEIIVRVTPEKPKKHIDMHLGYMSSDMKRFWEVFQLKTFTLIVDVDSDQHKATIGGTFDTNEDEDDE